MLAHNSRNGYYTRNLHTNYGNVEDVGVPGTADWRRRWCRCRNRAWVPGFCPVLLKACLVAIILLLPSATLLHGTWQHPPVAETPVKQALFRDLPGWTIRPSQTRDRQGRSHLFREGDWRRRTLAGPRLLCGRPDERKLLAGGVKRPLPAWISGGAARCIWWAARTRCGIPGNVSESRCAALYCPQGTLHLLQDPDSAQNRSYWGSEDHLHRDGLRSGAGYVRHLEGQMGKLYPKEMRTWEEHMSTWLTFYKYPALVKEAIYASNPIERMNKEIRKRL